MAAGCTSISEYSLTCQLWTTADFRTFNQPAPEPKLALYEASSGNRVLVQYDSVSDKPGKVTRKAYFCSPDAPSVTPPIKPRFAEPAVANTLKPIPIYSAEPDPADKSPPIPYAIATSEGGSFKFYEQRSEGKTIKLPVYPEHSGTATEVALTPFAVVGDTLMVTTVAGIVTVVELCRGNFSFRP